MALVFWENQSSSLALEGSSVFSKGHSFVLFHFLSDPAVDGLDGGWNDESTPSSSHLISDQQ